MFKLMAGARDFYVCPDRLETVLELDRLEKAIPFSSPELSPEDSVFEDQKKVIVDKVLSTLTPREQKILRMRFYSDSTLEECGLMFDVTRDRVRQIEQEALRKLRHPLRTDKLKELL